MEKITTSAEETKSLAKQLTKQLKLPVVLALYGDLGSGKTTFVQGLSKELGIKQNLVSPTFIIHRLYPFLKDNQLHHLDLYRLGENTNLEFLSLGEIFNDPNNLVVIEWPEKIEKLLPVKTIKINFEHLGNDKRKITWLDPLSTLLPE